MSKSTRLVLPDPLIECYNGTEIFIQWDGHWLCFPMWMIHDLINEWFETKYLGPKEEREKLDALVSWYRAMEQMPGEWNSPEPFEKLKDLLKDELPGWMAAYKLYNV